MNKQIIIESDEKTFYEPSGLVILKPKQNYSFMCVGDNSIYQIETNTKIKVPSGYLARVSPFEYTYDGVLTLPKAINVLSPFQKTRVVVDVLLLQKEFGTEITFDKDRPIASLFFTKIERVYEELKGVSDGMDTTVE
jgi:hypothetical protein